MIRLCYVGVAVLLLQTAVTGREVAITILTTTDLHGYILPTTDYGGRTNVGGLARCASVIEQVRKERPDAILVDAGDTFQGTPVSFLSDGLAMVKSLNYLHYDAWCWGNHEFDWGLEKLAACAEHAQIPVINANLGPDPDAGSGTNAASRILGRVKPYVIREIDGVKVGVVGLNTPGIPNWSRPRLIHGLQFAESVTTLKRVLPEMKRAGAQVIVLVCHQGYKEGGDDHANQIRAIAQECPELDAIIAGHTHRNVPDLKVNNILYCQADHHGIHLGRIDLVYDTEKRRVTERRANTMLMDDKIAMHPGLLKLLGAEIDRAEKLQATVVGEATGEFSVRGAPRKETPIHDLVFEAISAALQKEGVKVDAIVHGVLDSEATLTAGPITIGDVWRIVPYENTIGVARLLPEELREILEENVAAISGSSFRGIWGLKWTFDLRATRGNRTVSLRLADGSPLIAGKRLAVAFNSFDLASAGMRWVKLREIVNRPEAKLSEFNFQTRQAVIDYIRSQKRISPNVQNWWSPAAAAGAGEPPAKADER